MGWAMNSIRSLPAVVSRAVPGGRLWSRSGRLLRWSMAVVAVALAAVVASCATPGGGPALMAQTEVDLGRFMGRWYVIANIPYWPERGKVATRDEYRLREDGRIENVFVFRTDFEAPEQRWNGVSRVMPGSAGGHWRVRFIWPFETDLLVLAVADDYRWALLGHPQRKYGWIFARTPDIAAEEYQSLRQRMAEYGYDPDAFQRVPQRPEQVGLPGFQ